MMTLTCENVNATLRGCLAEEVPERLVILRVIARTFGFVRAKLEERAQDITDMLDQLPVEFSPEPGGGTSFLQGGETRDGVQWGEHTDMEELFALGMAIGRVRCLAPRKLWGMLPGGMPYYCVDTSKPVTIPEEVAVPARYVEAHAGMVESPPDDVDGAT